MSSSTSAAFEPRYHRASALVASGSQELLGKWRSCWMLFQVAQEGPWLTLALCAAPPCALHVSLPSPTPLPVSVSLFLCFQPSALFLKENSWASGVTEEIFF